VNCLHNTEGTLAGTNTDGEGFVASLDRGARFAPSGRRCLVVGAGGAARAVVLALATAGAAEVAVLNRTAARAADAAALAGTAGAVVAAEDPGAVARSVAAAELVVDATPVGLTGSPHQEAGRRLVTPDLLGPGQVVADLVYAPRPTAWLRAVSARGAVALDGLGMLVHQAAAQVAIWTGTPPPVEAMWRAAEEASPLRQA
jgi:shikimate dehydrogenase